MLEIVLEDLKPVQLLLEALVLLTMFLDPRLEEVYEFVDAREVVGRVAHDREIAGGG